ncbi:MAG: hypothetical protein ACTMHL_07995 [Janibacter sp.]
MAERQHPDERDVDAIFASIVARWDDPPAADSSVDPPTVDPVVPRRQSTGDVHLPSPPATKPDAPTEEPPAAPADPEPVPWRTDPTHSVSEILLGNDDVPGDADDDEGFTPPPPAPLPPATDRLFWGAMVGLVLGPLGLIWIALARPGGFWPKAIVIGLILGGFACLVLRQPTDRGYDPDQGARV